MADVLVEAFLGISPGTPARLLDEKQAQVSQNAKLPAGYLEALNDVSLEVSPGITGDIQSLFKMSSGGTDYWIAFADDVDVVKSLVSNDSTQRFYYTGLLQEPRLSNLSLATSGTPYPFAWFVLGVYPPATAPGISGAGGVSATNVSRSACYTFVTPFGEESQPSPASSVVTTKTDDTITITGMDVAPLNTFAVTSSSWASGTATLGMASTFGMRVGEYVSVAGMNPSGYNASDAKLITVTPTSVTYALAANPGAFVAGGTMTRKAPHNTTGMTKRIYSTITSASGTNFFFVKEIAVATTNTTFAGTFTPGGLLLTTDWEMPPTDIIGLVDHPNGFNFAFRSNEACFSEPGYPYAWPSKYRKGTTYKIVAAKVFGSSIVVGTEGTPYAFTGSDPTTINREQIDQPWPCLSKRGMVQMPYGVQYPAPQGLVRFGSQGALLVTTVPFRQEDWLELNPSTFYAAHYADRYVASYLVDGRRSLLVIDKDDNLLIRTVGIEAPVIYGDKGTGLLYLTKNNSVYKFDAAVGLKLNYDWLSKEFVFPAPINLAACKIDVDFSQTDAQRVAAQAAVAAAIAANAIKTVASSTAGLSPSFVPNKTAKASGRVNGFAVNGRAVNDSGLTVIPPVSWDDLTFILYAKGVVKRTKIVRNSKAFRLPVGYKSDVYSFRLQGNVVVKRVILAQSMDSLRGA